MTDGADTNMGLRLCSAFAYSSISSFEKYPKKDPEGIGTAAKVDATQSARVHKNIRTPLAFLMNGTSHALPTYVIMTIGGV